MMHGKMRVNIEILDDGMVVSWREPVKKAIHNPGRFGRDPMTKIWIESIPAGIDAWFATEEENETWNEEDRAWKESQRKKAEAMKGIFEKLRAEMGPKVTEKWVMTNVQVSIKNSPEDLQKVLARATQAAEETKKIEQSGEAIDWRQWRGYEPDLGYAMPGEGVIGVPATIHESEPFIGG